MKFSNIFSSKNSDCNCSKYYDLENNKDLEERIKKTTRIISNLKLLEKLENLGVSLYECRICGQLWQESLSWMHGNSKYIFKVPKLEIKDWKESTSGRKKFWPFLCFEKQFRISSALNNNERYYKIADFHFESSFGGSVSYVIGFFINKNEHRYNKCYVDNNLHSVIV